VIGAIKMNDYKGISQKLLRFQDDLRQIGSVACGAKIGSIPVAPTSLRLLRKLRLGKPHSVRS
jgi:hypothetical protein